MAEIKFCGLTSARDAAQAAALGARYAGVIFAGGPRHLDPASAMRVLDAAVALAPDVRRVGVFGALSADEIISIARHVRLDVIQLHADPDRAAVAALQGEFDGAVWGAVRVRGAAVPEEAASMFEQADAVVVDAKVGDTLGGTGTTVDWEALAAPLAAMRGITPLVLAGGLRAGNVAAAIETLAPDVVDVSSGVESSPGVKDHARMRAFVDAVRGLGVS